MASHDGQKEFVLTLRNRQVYDFYQQHRSVDFEAMNIFLVQFLEQILRTTEGEATSETLTTLFLTKLQGIEESIVAMKESVSKSQSDISLFVTAKIADAVRDCITDLRGLLAGYSAQQKELLEPMIQKVYEDVLPAAMEKFQQSMVAGEDKGVTEKGWLDLALTRFKDGIVSETAVLLGGNGGGGVSGSGGLVDSHTMTDFRQAMTSRIQEIQAVLSTQMAVSDSRVDSRFTETDRKMAELKELTTSNVAKQIALHGDVQGILRKFENSSGKGNASEMLVHHLLLGLYPSAEIQHVGNEQKETGDIMFSRANRPRILIENKEHESRNVERKDVEKFIRDCDLQDCCGIMMAQHRGIANKENFEIQFHNGNVLLYLHKVGFNPDIIKLGVDMVESLKAKLDEMRSEGGVGYAVPKEQMDAINAEFTAFAQQKVVLLRTMRDAYEKTLAMAQDLSLPTLEKVLQVNYAFAGTKAENICQFCDKFVPKSMATHLRFCERNPNRVGGGIGGAGTSGSLESAADGLSGGPSGGPSTTTIPNGGGGGGGASGGSAPSTKKQNSSRGKTRIK